MNSIDHVNNHTNCQIVKPTRMRMSVQGLMSSNFLTTRVTFSGKDLNDNGKYCEVFEILAAIESDYE